MTDYRDLKEDEVVFYNAKDEGIGIGIVYLDDLGDKVINEYWFYDNYSMINNLVISEHLCIYDKMKANKHWEDNDYLNHFRKKFPEYFI